MRCHSLMLSSRGRACTGFPSRLQLRDFAVSPHNFRRINRQDLRESSAFCHSRSPQTVKVLGHTSPKLSSFVFLSQKAISFKSGILSNILQTVPFLRSGVPFAVSRCISSVASIASGDTLCSVDESPGLKAMSDAEDDISDSSCISIPVRAFFFSTSVDLKSFVDQNKQNVIPPPSRMSNYVVLRFGDLNPDLKGLGCSLGESDCSYMVVFQYGSIVLFNVGDNEVDGYLKIVERHASGLLPEMRKDEYEVRENQTLDEWMQGGLDYIMLHYLRIDGIRTIGSVLGQSIALDYYVRQVDGIVAEFTDINREMEKTGNFTMERKKLFQLVGKANSILADVIIKLGLFERSDIAWKDAKYAQIWEYLRDEFELTQRFASLDFKLKFVEHNIRFLQEILQNRKSDFLEVLIVILIGVEILLSVYDIAHRSSITSF